VIKFHAAGEGGPLNAGAKEGQPS